MTAFVGIDLAWGPKAASGIAVIDSAGRVAAIDRATTDDQIVTWVQEHAEGPCLVAFDAPLIVKNRSGQRDCERLVNRYFGRFHAGCHPSNLNMAAFQDGGRAHRIADHLGLDVDPASSAPRRAIEVYPHPAIVMLFDLDTIIKYKNRRRRSRAEIQAELSRLMSYLELLPSLGFSGLGPWPALREAAEQATTKAALKWVEDQVDAVVCAHIAWLFHTKRESVRILGDVGSGYIVTPIDAATGSLIDSEASPPGQSD